MQTVLFKIFVLRFYRANAGFFLFFFFLFFGAVEGSALLRYHLSLMQSLLGSGVILLGVFVFWTLYHLKCTGFFLKILNSEEGQFLYNLQTLGEKKLRTIYAVFYTAVYAPVLVYGVLVFAVGIKKGYALNACIELAFQLLSTTFFAVLIYWRGANWLAEKRRPLFTFRFPKTLYTVLLFYFTSQQQKLLFGVKVLSLGLLYTVLVWNGDRYDNDGFLLFWLVLFLAHAALPYFAVRFWEERFPACRNLPLSLITRSLLFLLPYAVLILPEMVYLVLQAHRMPLAHRFFYGGNLLCSLALLTAVQYNGAQNREGYLSAAFALGFVSLFVFHAQAFLFWMAVQTVMAVTLFAAGYYAFEKEGGD